MRPFSLGLIAAVSILASFGDAEKTTTVTRYITRTETETETRYSTRTRTQTVVSLIATCPATSTALPTTRTTTTTTIRSTTTSATPVITTTSAVTTTTPSTTTSTTNAPTSAVTNIDTPLTGLGACETFPSLCSSTYATKHTTNTGIIGFCRRDTSVLLGTYRNSVQGIVIYSPTEPNCTKIAYGYGACCQSFGMEGLNISFIEDGAFQGFYSDYYNGRIGLANNLLMSINANTFCGVIPNNRAWPYYIDLSNNTISNVAADSFGPNCFNQTQMNVNLAGNPVDHLS
ncbi:hypothetical protein HDV00_004552 [Rhizophlyctis rosea]|nr:hypothetical protein HDV00_004552 [Rhizophlyctis rosea]